MKSIPFHFTTSFVTRQSNGGQSDTTSIDLELKGTGYFDADAPKDERITYDLDAIGFQKLVGQLVLSNAKLSFLSEINEVVMYHLECKFGLAQPSLLNIETCPN